MLFTVARPGLAGGQRQRKFYIQLKGKLTRAIGIITKNKQTKHSARGYKKKV